MFVLRVKDEGGFETLQEATSGGQGPTHLAVAEDGKALLIAHVSSLLGEIGWVLGPRDAAAAGPSPDSSIKLDDHHHLQFVQSLMVTA